MESKYFKEYVIYEIVNNINNKKYIGCTSNFLKRKSLHKSKLNAGIHSNKHLQHAWKKYGSENFQFLVTNILNNKEEMFELEENLIDHFSEKFYNLHKGGCGGTTWNKLSGNAALIISKISKAHKGIPKTKEHKAKLSLSKSKPCYILGIKYPSKKIAVEITGINEVTMWARLKNPKFTEYYYL
jgi:group I intron endonuclease